MIDPTSRFNNSSTYFPEHRSSRLPTSTAANKRAEFKASRKFAIEVISPKTSIQNNEFLSVPESIHLKHQSNGIVSDNRSTTFSPLPSIIIDVDNLSFDNPQILTDSSKSKEIVMKDASTGTTSEREINKHKKDPIQRIFVGRSLRLEKIKFFGFDLDYTICGYKSPAYESMVFERTITRLVEIGYPEKLKSLKYDSSFAVRGLWFDLLYGNLLKVDSFGNLLTAVHGFHFLDPSEVESLYPTKFLHLNDRVIVLNTLFNLPDTFLLACLVDYFDTSNEFKVLPDKTGVKEISGETIITYKSIGRDVENCVQWIHTEGSMKRHVLQNLDKYVIKDERIKQLLLQLRQNGGQVFLLTNSEYFYTHGILEYLIGKDWLSYFDLTIVDAKKPHWFSEGSVFREVDVSTGNLKLGIHLGPMKRGKVLSGGSCEAFIRLMKARGKEVLYTGDHIFGDVLKSKKSRGWRTFLIIPELEHELIVWTERHSLFDQIAEIDLKLAELYKNLDATSSRNGHAEIREAVNAIRLLTHKMNEAYGILGSLFRSGSRTTFFATQVERYADVYAVSPFNLLYYPSYYFFRAPLISLPHEGTVDHLAKVGKNQSLSVDTRGVQTPLIHEDEPNFEENDDIARSKSVTPDLEEKFRFK